MAIGKAFVVLLVFGLIASTCPTHARTLQDADLVQAAGNVLGAAFKSVENGLFALVNGLFGPDNTFFTKIPDDVKDLSWGSLQNLGLNTPIGTFVNSIKSANLPTDILAAETKITDFLEDFCEEAECKPSQKIPSNCAGKSMVVRLAPWQCSLYKNGTVGCSPPFIEILTAPASCSAKYYKAGTYTGKECKLQKKIGQTLTKSIGGQAFSVNINKALLDVPKAIATALLPNEFDNAVTSTLDEVSGVVGGATSAVGGVLNSAGSAASTVLSSLSGR